MIDSPYQYYGKEVFRMSQNNPSDKRYFVFIGKENWPKEATVGDTIQLSLYEYLQARPVDLEVKVKFREDCPKTIFMQGETTYERQNYSVEISLHKIDVFNNNVVLTRS